MNKENTKGVGFKCKLLYACTGGSKTVLKSQFIDFGKLHRLVNFKFQAMRVSWQNRAD